MLHIHRAERADRLVEALAEVLAAPPTDPLAAEVVAVPTRGVERWLAQRLSGRLGASAGRGDGVCANVAFPFPGRLVREALAAAAGGAEEDDPWPAERLVWPLLEVVDECLGEPWLGALAAHLGGDGGGDEDSRRLRRFPAVRHVADLFDRYAVHRPAMLRAWAAGEDTDGEGRPLPAGAAWQAELWRRARARLGVPGPAERLEAACALLRDDPSVVALPERLSIFGLTRLPASHLEVLAALGAGRDVHLFLLHPSPALWERVAEATAGRALPRRRADDPTARLVRNPLLRSWGRDARETQIVLAGAGPVADHHHPVDEPPDTLLRRIQADVRADRPPPGEPLPGQPDLRPVLASDDRSLEVHACHGRARQVEVVRDAILHLLAEDETLEPRDVIVMCPDIESFAPLVHAAFGSGERVEGEEDEDGAVPPAARPPDLRVRLADRSLRQTNPVLGVVAALLDLASSRVTASQVLDLAGREPVRRRFGLDDDDLARLQEWASASGVRWGLDAAHRAPFRLEAVEANTWRSGLDRVLVGAAMAEEDGRLVGGVLPLDDVDSGAIDLAGRLAELVERLGDALDSLTGLRPVAEWAAAIAAAADRLTAVADRDAWQRDQLTRILEEVVAEASAGGEPSRAPIALAEVRALLADRLRGRPTRANFRTGHLTVCTLVPMRSVPHRVVCLMGLDDGVFPRRTARDGDDVTLEDPHVGDRDPRSEDRQLLLDALMAATDRLVIAYAGRDERTNAERPPAVPIGELLDVVDRTVRVEGGGRARDRVLVRHPLQPFDPRNFRAGGIVPGRRWSFDAVALEGARAMGAERPPRAPFLAGPLPPAREEAVELDALVRFVQHPVRAFLRQRLNITLDAPEEDRGDALPIELDGLEAWGVGQRLLEARLAGLDADAARRVELARGLLPPGALAERLLGRLEPVVERLVAEANALAAGGEPASLEVNLRLPDGRPLVGTVAGVTGDLLREVTYSRVGHRARIAAWVRFLALSAAHPEQPFQSVLIGRRREDGTDRAWITVARIPPLEGPPGRRRDEALELLASLVELRDRGLREPLPLYCRASAMHAEAAGGGRGRGRAATAWNGTYRRPGECRDPEHRLVLGGVLPFEEVAAEQPRDDERGAGWNNREQTRFGRYARRLWDPLLAREEIVDR